MVTSPMVKVEVHSPVDDGIIYLVEFSDGMVGDAVIKLKRIDDFGSEPDDVLENVLNEGGMVADITMFFPNGHGSHEKILPYMRHGIGSFLIERIIKDAASAGASAVFACTASGTMKEFLVKNGFYAYGPGNIYHYRLIEP